MLNWSIYASNRKKIHVIPLYYLVLACIFVLICLLYMFICLFLYMHSSHVLFTVTSLAFLVLQAFRDTQLCFRLKFLF